MDSPSHEIGLGQQQFYFVFVFVLFSLKRQNREIQSLFLLLDHSQTAGPFKFLEVAMHIDVLNVNFTYGFSGFYSDSGALFLSFHIDKSKKLCVWCMCIFI